MCLTAMLALAACAGSQTTTLLEAPASDTLDLPLDMPGDVAAKDTAGPPARHIVVLKPSASAGDRDVLAATLACPPSHSYGTVFKGFAGEMTAEEVEALEADPLVKYVERDVVDGLLDGFTYDAGLGHLDLGGASNWCDPAFDTNATIPIDDRYTGSQPVDWGADRIDADLNGGPGGAGVGVAILDTGIDMDHEDFDSGTAVIANYNAIHTARPAEDAHGHGTHVAGIVAARDNALGYVGVAPAADLIAVKVLDNLHGQGFRSWIVAGIDWVAANQATYNIKVANMSLGGTGTSQAYQDAIDAATALGVTFVVAAGNDWNDASGYTPANCNNVICVSALERNPKSGGGPFTYQFWRWSSTAGSNWGSIIDLIAPGEFIYSTTNDGAYGYMTGTSMAAPHVSGAAALWLDNHPTDSYAQVLAGLLANAEAAPPGGWTDDGDSTGEPLVDAQWL